VGADVQHYAAGTLNIRMLFRKVNSPSSPWHTLFPPSHMPDYEMFCIRMLPDTGQLRLHICMQALYRVAY